MSLRSIRVSDPILNEQITLEIKESSGANTVHSLTNEQAIQLAKDIHRLLPGYIPDKTVPTGIITSLIDALQKSMDQVEDLGYISVTTRVDAKKAIEQAYGVISIADPEAHAAYIQLTAAEQAHKQARQRFSQAFSIR